MSCKSSLYKHAQYSGVIPRMPTGRLALTQYNTPKPYGAAVGKSLAHGAGASLGKYEAGMVTSPVISSAYKAYKNRGLKPNVKLLTMDAGKGRQALGMIAQKGPRGFWGSALKGGGKLLNRSFVGMAAAEGASDAFSGSKANMSNNEIYSRLRAGATPNLMFSAVWNKNPYAIAALNLTGAGDLVYRKATGTTAPLYRKEYNGNRDLYKGLGNILTPAYGTNISNQQAIHLHSLYNIRQNLKRTVLNTKKSLNSLSDNNPYKGVLTQLLRSARY